MGSSLRLDLRFAWRDLRRNPAFALTSVVVLAVGIAAVTVTFSALYGVVLRALPFAEPDRLVWVWATTDTGSLNSVSASDFYDYRSQCRSFASIGAHSIWRPGRVLTGGAEPERVQGGKVSGGLFATLGVPPMLGRSFVPDEEIVDGPRVVVVSHGLWQRRLGGRPDVVGSPLEVDGETFQVVGVMPDGFAYPRGVDLWFPIQRGGNEETSRGNNNFSIIGRLAEGADLATAQAELDLIAAAVAKAEPADRKGWGVRLVPLHERFFGSVGPTMWMLTGATVLLLLIACANLSSLLLARVIGRRGELAMRRVLGASAWAIARQVVTEGMVIAGIGTAVGLALAWCGVRAVRALGPSTLPRLQTIGLDRPVLLAAVVATALCGLLLGLVPALHGARADTLEELKSSGHNTSGARSLRLRALLVGTQTALSVVLLVTSGLVVKSLVRLQQVEPGFEPRGLLTVDLQLPGFRYASTGEVEGLTASLLARLRSLPGVVEVAAADQLPPFGGPWNGVYRSDRPPQTPADRLPATRRLVTDGYFRTLGAPMLLGRELGPDDRLDSRPVTVISRALAERLFPGESPLGRIVVLPWGNGIALEVVGVAGDIKDDGLADDSRPVFYIPLRQYPLPSFRVVLRTRGEPEAVVPLVRQTIREVEKDAALFNIGTMEGWLADSLAASRFAGVLVGVFSLVALLLAATGLYGVMACFVAERRREIGIRMAVGAGPGAVFGWVVRKGVLVTAGGAALGLVSAVGSSRLLEGMLFATTATDPATYLVVSAVLLLTALVACAVPARRAVRADPSQIIRSE